MTLNAFGYAGAKLMSDLSGMAFSDGDEGGAM